jgi:hypothetical protein
VCCASVFFRSRHRRSSNLNLLPLRLPLCRPYQAPGAGLGGSAAHAFLNGKDPVQSELDLGVGWQDPAVIRETGLCVWRSGPKPVLDFKVCRVWTRLGGQQLIFARLAHAVLFCVSYHHLYA